MSGTLKGAISYNLQFTSLQDIMKKVIKSENASEDEGSQMFTKKAKLTWMFEKIAAKGLKELSQSESHHVRLSKKLGVLSRSRGNRAS